MVYIYMFYMNLKEIFSFCIVNIYLFFRLIAEELLSDSEHLKGHPGARLLKQNIHLNIYFYINGLE